MIRAARPDELGDLSALAFRSKAVWGYSTEFMEACREELTIDEDDLENTFVKEVDGAIVGFCTLSRLDPNRAELDFLFVEPSALRRGHGLELIEHAKQRTRQMGMAALVIQGDPNAAAFYLTAGARQVGERPSDSIPGRMLPLYVVDVTSQTKRS